MTPSILEDRLCRAFCGGVSVNPIASGFAISSLFTDASGDRISFYLTPELGGFSLEDDGSYLADLIARDVPINDGTRGQLLDAILEQGQAFWDSETLEIKTSVFAESDIEGRVIDFLSSMIRVRDLALLTRTNIRSTFRDDAIETMKRRLSNVANIETNVAPDRSFNEFPADVVIRPKEPLLGKAGAVFLVSNNERLTEALLLQSEALRKNNKNFKTIALIEDAELKGLSRKKFQRAQNRGLPMPIFRGEEEEAIDMIARTLNLPVDDAA